MPKREYMDYRNKRHRSPPKRALAAAVLAVLAVAAAGIFAACSGSDPAKSSSVPSKPASSKAAESKPAIKPAPVKTTRKIPVLMYHSINHDPHDPGNILRVPKDKFAAEMKWLYDNGYKTISLDELYDYVENKKPVPEKTVVLTFDDGYEDNYQSALPVIEKYHFKATVFMISARIGDSKNGYLTAPELKEMDKNGMQIECHTVDHLDLSTLSYSHQERELTDSKATLEKLLGHPIDYLAYPSGKYDADTIAIAKKAGYKLCFKMNGGIATVDDSRYEFPRAFVGEDLNDFIKRVEGTADYSK